MSLAVNEAEREVRGILNDRPRKHRVNRIVLELSEDEMAHLRLFARAKNTTPKELLHAKVRDYASVVKLVKEIAKESLNKA